jgi:replicative DNA helicase
MGMLVLGTLATAAQGRFRVQIKQGYSEPLNLFLATALPPGSRKSAAFSLATKPLENFEHEHAQKERVHLKRKAAEQRVLQRAIKNAENKAAQTLDDDERQRWMDRAHTLTEKLEGTKAQSPRLMADDVTPQKLVSLLQQHGRIGVLSSEAGIFSKMASQGTMDVYLKSWAGETIAVDRQSRASVCIRNPLLTIALTIQPSVLKDLGTKAAMHGRGLIGRFLFSLPKNLMGRRNPNPPPIPPAILDEYNAYLYRLLKMPTKDVPLTFSTDAQQEWFSFLAAIEPRLCPDGDLGPITDWAGKLAGHVARIAGLIHIATNIEEPDSAPLPPETVHAAVTIGHYLLAHAKATFHAMHIDDGITDAQHVLRWVKANRQPSFNLRDAYQALKGNRRFRTMALLQSPIQALTEHQYIRERQEIIARRAGRKPSPVYEVNPYLWAGNGYSGDCEQRLLDGGESCAM